MIHENKNRLDGWLFEVVDFNLQENLLMIYYYQWHDESVLMEMEHLMIKDKYDIIGCLVQADSFIFGMMLL
jgi:hypothetical protein